MPRTRATLAPHRAAPSRRWRGFVLSRLAIEHDGVSAGRLAIDYDEGYIGCHRRGPAVVRIIERQRVGRRRRTAGRKHGFGDIVEIEAAAGRSRGGGRRIAGAI